MSAHRGPGGAPGLLARRVAGLARRRLAPAPSARAGIAHLAAVAGVAAGPADSPVFVLGAGWRTGSTWLQRMLNATPGTLVWGEPWTEAALVPRMAESLAFLDPRRGRFSGRVLPAGAPLPAGDEWTATLTPPTGALLHAQRAMLDRLWRDPAAAHGCPRWGVKETTWGRDCIDLLAVLYPGARFLLLVRDPVEQWRSYRPHTGRAWYERYPDRPVAGPHAFGRMSDRLVRDFVAADRDHERATLVRYEDLASAAERARLAAFLGLDRPLPADLPRVGSSAGSALWADAVPGWERTVVRARTAGSRRLVGYR